MFKRNFEIIMRPHMFDGASLMRANLAYHGVFVSASKAKDAWLFLADKKAVGRVGNVNIDAATALEANMKFGLKRGLKEEYIVNGVIATFVIHLMRSDLAGFSSVEILLKESRSKIHDYSRELGALGYIISQTREVFSRRYADSYCYDILFYLGATREVDSRKIEIGLDKVKEYIEMTEEFFPGVSLMPAFEQISNYMRSPGAEWYYVR